MSEAVDYSYIYGRLSAMPESPIKGRRAENLVSSREAGELLRFIRDTPYAGRFRGINEGEIRLLGEAAVEGHLSDRIEFIKKNIPGKDARGLSILYESGWDAHNIKALYHGLKGSVDASEAVSMTSHLGSVPKKVFDDLITAGQEPQENRVLPDRLCRWYDEAKKASQGGEVNAFETVVEKCRLEMLSMSLSGKLLETAGMRIDVYNIQYMLRCGRRDSMPDRRLVLKGLHTGESNLSDFERGGVKEFLQGLFTTPYYDTASRGWDNGLSGLLDGLEKVYDGMIRQRRLREPLSLYTPIQHIEDMLREAKILRQAIAGLQEAS